MQWKKPLILSEQRLSHLVANQGYTSPERSKPLFTRVCQFRGLAGVTVKSGHLPYHVCHQFGVVPLPAGVGCEHADVALITILTPIYAHSFAAREMGGRSNADNLHQIGSSTTGPSEFFRRAYTA